MIKDYQRDKFGLFYLSKDDFEDLVEEILADYDPELLETPKAIDIEDFVENYLGLTIEYHKLTKDESLFGLYAFSDGCIDVYDEDDCKKIFVKKKTIVIDTMICDIDGGVYGFTLGHEAAHHICHSDVMDEIITDRTDSEHFADVCYRSNTIGKRKLETKEDWMEWQANAFSSRILMNRPAVLKLIENTLGYPVEYKSGFLKQLGPLSKLYLVTRIRDTFKVSTSAARIRLDEISGE